MAMFQWANWPLWLICSGMIAAAVIDWWKFKVPNKLTFPLILSGWVVGLANDFGLGAGDGGRGGALSGSFIGVGVLFPSFAIAGRGAVDCQVTRASGS